MTNLLNVGAVTLDGVELESTGILFYGLFAHLGLAYNRAITTDFKNAPNEDSRKNDKDLSGQQLYNAPLWSGNLGLEQMLPLSDAFQGAIALEYSYRTGTYGTVEHGRATYIDRYGLANARFSLVDINREWRVTLWVRNLLDQNYIAAVQPLYGVGDYGAFAGDPRTIGMTLRFDFR
jgi:iron complex outermembrane receptor protein